MSSPFSRPAGREWPWTKSRTFWSRLEPRTRDTTLSRTLRSDVHDPAWMLCRQWQVGEFQGEDAGSPIDATFEYVTERVSRYALGPWSRTPEPIELPGDPRGFPESLDLSVEQRLLDDVLGETDALLSAIENSGSRDPDAVAGVLESWLVAGTSANVRRSELRYLRVSLPVGTGSDVDFFDRTTSYLAAQPPAAVSDSGVSVFQFLAALEAYVNGWQGASQAVFAADLIAATATVPVVRTFRTVVGFAHDAAVAAATPPDADSSTETDDTGSEPYTGGPLEAIVEREPVTSLSDGPDARTRVEAGRRFLAGLTEAGYVAEDGPFVAADFPGFRYERPDEPLDPESERFISVAAGRTLDGHAVYTALVDGVANITDAVSAPADSFAWSDADVGRLPLPADESATSLDDLPAEYRTAATEYYQWYRAFYSQPDRDPDHAGTETDDGSDPRAATAWSADRMEYTFRVATGPEAGSYPGSDGDDVVSGETVFEARAYPGGRLDWDSFSTVTSPFHGSLDAPADADLVATGRESTLPSKVSFPGMPAPRWWEFEDAAVSLDRLSTGAESLSRLLLLDFTLVYGNDWYVVPLDVPVGSLTRIVSFEVTDTFGQTTDIEPVTADDDDWNAFMFDDLPAGVATDGEPGLFFPPVLGRSAEGDPIERVALARDEAANLAFGIEEVVESAAGRPLRRAEFRTPALDIEAVTIPDASPTAGTESETTTAGDTASTEEPTGAESVTLRNVGDAPLAIGEWQVESADGTVLYVFDADASLGPDAIVTVHFRTDGVDVNLDDADGEHVVVDRETAVWPDGTGAVEVYHDGPGDRDERFIAREPVSRPAEWLPDYRLSTAIAENWYPLKPVRPRDEGRDDDEYRLALARLLDARSMDDPLGRLPKPAGAVLSPEQPLRLYEEEVPRAGRRVTRSDQLARWSDGQPYLWRGRRSTSGRGERASGLAYDVLLEGSRPTRSTSDDDGFIERITDGIVVDAIEPTSPGGPNERLEEEAVVLLNQSPKRIDLSGWSVRDEAGHRYTFPDGTSVKPGAALSLRTGHGTDTDIERYWGRSQSVWNDHGDTVYVYDAAEELVARRGYPFPSAPLTETPVVVDSVAADVPGDDRDRLADETVTFANTGADTIDVSQWLVTDRGGHAYRFPDGTTIGGGDRLTLHTGTGSDTDSDRFWGESSPVWNNDRDVVLVYDETGALVIRQVFRAGTDLVR